MKDAKKKKPITEKNSDQNFVDLKIYLKEVTRNIDRLGQKQKETTRNIDRLGQKQEETTRNIDRLSKEQEKVTRNIDRLSREQEKTTRNINKLSGDWDSRWGRFVENLVSGNLKKILKGWGVSIKNIIIKRNVFFFTTSHQQWEFDILVINGTDIFVIEVKSTLTIDKIDRFIKQLQNLVETRDDFPDKKIYAAIAYLGVAKGKEEDFMVKYAQDQGLYVICAAGDAAKSVEMSSHFKPRIFSKIKSKS